VSRFKKPRLRLVDLKTLWKEVYLLDSRITLAATAEDRKKLSYFLQDEFLAAKDAYNEAAGHLQEAILKRRKDLHAVLTLYSAMERKRPR